MLGSIASRPGACLAVVAAAAILLGPAPAAHGPGAPPNTPITGEAETALSPGPGDEYLNAQFGGATTIDASAFSVPGAQAQALAAHTARTSPATARLAWHFQGPTDIGGRIADLAVDPRRSGTVYIATAGGGVWKTADSGRTFTSAWPVSYPQEMGAIAVAADGTVYAGTGEANPGGGSITFGGDGVYRSTDGGVNWTRVGLVNSGTIGRIVVDPKAPNRVYVAATGNLYIPGGQRGLYVSDDRGATWRRLLAPPNETTGAADVQVDPADPRRIYVGMWDHIRYPDSRTYTGTGSGVWRSLDGGRSWTHLSVANRLLPDSAANGRVGIGIDPSTPRTVYVVYANEPSGAFEAFFKSTDGGDTFAASPQAQAQLADSQYVYGWWFARIYVDPHDSGHLYLMGLNLWESKDGGTTFTAQSSMHSDQHAMAWDPKVRDSVYLGDDGGFYHSTANGSDSSWDHSANEPWSQYDGLDVSETDPTRIAGGLQDNGSVRSWGGKDWSNYYGGDGQQNLINPRNPNLVFACLQYGNCARSTDGGATMTEFDQTVASSRHNYFTPMAFDPRDPSIVYYAGEIVNRSTDGGANWTPISTDLGKTDPGREINPLYAAHYGTVTTIAPSAHNSKLVWAGTHNGHLWYTTDLMTWTEVVSPVLPARWISHVAIDPANDSTVYVTYSGFRQGDHTSYVMRTTDGGTSWSDVSANLPQAPVNDLAVISGRLYVATDVGVYVSPASGTPTWLTLGQGLPNTSVTHLRYVPTNRSLYVSTFGRGVWSVRLS